LHELGHWTGGREDRVPRNLKGKFGSENYAREELRAEMASAFLCAALGTVNEIEENASYIASWLQVLKEDALRSGDLYIPKSKQHVSFWDLLLNESCWNVTKEASYMELQQPQGHEIIDTLNQEFFQTLKQAEKNFVLDSFANIEHGKLRLKRIDKAAVPSSVTNLQKVINASMPSVRIEQLLMEVDQWIGFSRYFTPIQSHNSRPRNFYTTRY
jgi:hypothetical protein